LASAGAAAVRGYGASAGSGVLPPTADRSTSLCCLRHTPGLPRLSALWGRGSVPGSAPLRACRRFDLTCPRRAGLAPLLLPLPVRSSGASPALRKPGSRGFAFSDRSHDLDATEGRRALGVWRKQAKDGLRSLVGAMDGGAERCARPPGHGGPRRSRRSCPRPNRHGGPVRSRSFCFTTSIVTAAPSGAEAFASQSPSDSGPVRSRSFTLSTPAPRFWPSSHGMGVLACRAGPPATPPGPA